MVECESEIKFFILFGKDTAFDCKDVLEQLLEMLIELPQFPQLV